MEFSVLQGSTQGAFLFISYASTLDEVVPKDLQPNGFTDDHSLWKYFKLKDELATIADMLDVKSWMDAVHLKMNESKQNSSTFGSSTVNINGEHIVRSDNVKYLGGLLDSTLSFHQHVITKYQAANINIQKIRHIRKYFPHQRHLSVINTITCHVAP